MVRVVQVYYEFSESFQVMSMMMLISSTVKEHGCMEDVEPHFLANFGILEDLALLTNDRFGTINLSQIILN